MRLFSRAGETGGKGGPPGWFCVPDEQEQAADEDRAEDDAQDAERQDCSSMRCFYLDGTWLMIGDINSRHPGQSKRYRGPTGIFGHKVLPFAPFL